MFLLDTDHMSLIERGGAECRRIQARLRSVPLDDIGTTIISYEEQLRGWLERVNQAQTPTRRISIYAQLKKELRNYCDIPVFEFDEDASNEFERLKSIRINIGTMDLKIASIALANNATILSRNHSDFGKVPGLKFEDWSI